MHNKRVQFRYTINYFTKTEPIITKLHCDFEIGILSNTTLFVFKSID